MNNLVVVTEQDLSLAVSFLQLHGVLIRVRILSSFFTPFPKISAFNQHSHRILEGKNIEIGQEFVLAPLFFDI